MGNNAFTPAFPPAAHNIKKPHQPSKMAELSPIPWNAEPARPAVALHTWSLSTPTHPPRISNTHGPPGENISPSRIQTLRCRSGYYILHTDHRRLKPKITIIRGSYHTSYVGESGNVRNTTADCERLRRITLMGN